MSAPHTQSLSKRHSFGQAACAPTKFDLGPHSLTFQDGTRETAPYTYAQTAATKTGVANGTKRKTWESKAPGIEKAYPKNPIDIAYLISA